MVAGVRVCVRERERREREKKKEKKGSICEEICCEVMGTKEGEEERD